MPAGPAGGTIASAQRRHEIVWVRQAKSSRRMHPIGQRFCDGIIAAKKCAGPFIDEGTYQPLPLPLPKPPHERTRLMAGIGRWHGAS